MTRHNIVPIYPKDVELTEDADDDAPLPSEALQQLEQSRQLVGALQAESMRHGIAADEVDAFVEQAGIVIGLLQSMIERVRQFAQWEPDQRSS